MYGPRVVEHSVVGGALLLRNVGVHLHRTVPAEHHGEMLILHLGRLRLAPQVMGKQ